jgi:hypothetical protein
MAKSMTFTEQIYAALKRVQKVLDTDLGAAPVPIKNARIVQAWYEAQFGEAVRAAVTRVERGGQ